MTDHDSVPHDHVHTGEASEHAHVHRQEDGYRRSSALREGDDEIGCLVTGGTVPREVPGRHCRWCGEAVELRPVKLPLTPGEFIAEYQHAKDGYVHCVIAWENERAVAIAESTAQPCWSNGCLSNDEHEAVTSAPPPRST